MSYDNELKISLWKSDGTNAKAPILKGKATINGTEYEVALWKNDSDNPRAPTLKGKLQLPQSRSEADDQPAFKAPLAQEEDWKEDIPF
jgi:hypothetical protein